MTYQSEHTDVDSALRHATMADRQTPTESNVPRWERITGAIAVVALVATGFAIATKNTPTEKSVGTPLCNFYGLQDVQPSDGSGGTDTITHMVIGSGDGEGDICWEPTVTVVEDVVATGIPRIDHTYTIPQFVTIQKLDMPVFVPAE